MEKYNSQTRKKICKQPLCRNRKEPLKTKIHAETFKIRSINNF